MKGSRWEADLDDEHESPKAGFEYKAVPPYNGRYWAYSKDNLVEYAIQGRLIHTESGMPEYKRYLDEMPGMPLQDIWTDINPLNSQANERLDYPTQKPLTLLERIINSSSDEGDIILDAYCGCGTTIDAAQKLKRNWIGIDITYHERTVRCSPSGVGRRTTPADYQLKCSTISSTAHEYKSLREPGAPAARNR